MGTIRAVVRQFNDLRTVDALAQLLLCTDPIYIADNPEGP